MSKIETISYRSNFSVAEITILNDYLDTDTGNKDNNVSSYIKVYIEKFLAFLEENLKSYIKDIETCEAVETLKESLLTFKQNKVQILGFK